jgi:hypothetical protein
MVFVGLAFVTFTGILFNVDPYTTTPSIRIVFFVSGGIVLASLIALAGYSIKRRNQ